MNSNVEPQVAAQHVVDATLCIMKFEPLHALDQRREQSRDFHPRQVVADALVLAKAEADVIHGAAFHLEAVGVFPFAGITVCSAV